MLVIVVLLELHIEFAHSLKEKRMVVKSLRDRLRHEFGVTPAEVALQDEHQRARLGLSFVTSDRRLAESMLEKLRDYVEASTDAVVAGWTSEILEFDETAV